MEELNLKEIKSVILEKKIFIILVILFSLIIGIAYSFFVVVPEYSSTSKVLIEKTESSMTEFIKNNDILQDSLNNLNINNLKLDQLRENTKLTYESQTKTITITVVSTNSRTASEVANEIANVLTKKIEETYDYKNTKILQSAVDNNNPINVNYIKDIFIFIVIGILICGGYVFLILLKRANLVQEEEGISNEYNILGKIPYEPKVSQMNKELIASVSQKLATSDFFRKTITNIELNKIIPHPKSILVTSTTVNEGKSFISANLATSFAKIGKKVLLIDADILSGRLDRIFEVEDEYGFSDLLVKSTKLDTEAFQLNTYVKTTKVDNLDIITAGKNDTNNSYELLMSSNLDKLLNIFNKLYDIVILDGIAALDLSDSIIISNYVDATVLVTEYNRTNLDDLKNTRENIEKVGGKILGVIINKIPKYNEEYKSLVKYKKNVANKAK